MQEQNSPFNKLHVEEVTAAKRTLLDELNLPPKLKHFILNNARILQSVFVVGIILIAAWNFYSYYTEKQRNDSAAQLAHAIQQTDAATRHSELQKVIKDFSGSGAAVWSRITLAHDLVDKKDYTKAREEIATIKHDVSKSNPLYPLLIFDLGQVSEMNGDLANALDQYKALREIPGFAVLGYLGEVRVYEQKNDAAKVRDTLEQLKTQTDLQPTVREWVDAKLAVL